MKNLLILILFFNIFCCESKNITVTFHIPPFPTTQNSERQKSLIAWKSFLKQCMVAYGVHYCGQSFTHNLFKNNRDLARSPLAFLISIAQTYTSMCVSNSIQELIAHEDRLPAYGWAHFWGWLAALESDKKRF